MAAIFYIRIKAERFQLARYPNAFESPTFPAQTLTFLGSKLSPKPAIHTCACGKPSKSMAFHSAPLFPFFVCENCNARYLVYSCEPGEPIEVLRANEHKEDQACARHQ